MKIRRLQANDAFEARRLFALMATVFGEEHEVMSDARLLALLARDDFYAMAAFVDGAVVGGATAYALPMTRTPIMELFLYDIAVAPEHQRSGIGRALVLALRDAAGSAGIEDMFVAADNEDQHALDFYRALGGVASAATFYSFRTPGV